MTLSSFYLTHSLRWQASLQKMFASQEEWSELRGGYYILQFEDAEFLITI